MSATDYFLAASGGRLNGTDRLFFYAPGYLTTENRYPDFHDFPLLPDGTSPLTTLLQTPARNLPSACLGSDDCMVLSARQTIQSSDRHYGS
ncbi:hypothetical protein HKD21_09215 [Gluconobacter cerevisiae]|uniref:Uncharacterized protein n=1 Tax=Gluconobacter cerevisiae TaxID=1379734 RepID=A0ABR9YEC9_9PROT|nr:hypothetical protein [Gluconobacter cerevisiae]MBF0877028.1 hypothetical protein [Gluconobacter cerevisiae]